MSAYPVDAGGVPRARHKAAPAGPAPDAGPATVPGPAPAASGRDRYLDLLRAVALVRVVVFHIFGWAWLTILFPSMGVMFALAGSLMARSLSKRGSWSVIRGRMRRLLPPMWAFALLIVPLLFVTGWQPARDEGVWGLIKLANWVFPFGAPSYPDPSGTLGSILDSTWADQAAGPLWYIRAYLWFVLASPLLLWAFRKAPLVTLLFPVALTAVIGTGLVDIPGETGLALTDFAVYGACWVLGFAHNDGMFKKIPRYITISLATLTMAFGLWWASGHLGPEGWNFDEMPLAEAAWSLGFVAILLQYSPSWQKLPGRLAQFDSGITLANNRAVTIYLWHNLLIMCTVPIIDQLWKVPGIDGYSSELNASYSALTLILIWPLIGLLILAMGWVEDVAAKRRPRLWPNGSKSAAGSGGGRQPVVPGGSHKR
jgi:peptidoglycan/LPS O-acetylase OafA/YrhL